MNSQVSRRQFLRHSSALAAGLSLTPFAHAEDKPMPFKISLAEWSLHRALFGRR
jgi:hypothetical protein